MEKEIAQGRESETNKEKEGKKGEGGISKKSKKKEKDRKTMENYVSRCMRGGGALTSVLVQYLYKKNMSNFALI